MNRNADKIRSRVQPDDEMGPEYSFSGGERGRYAHLFGESDQDENLVASFWEEKGFGAVRFEKNETRSSKTPDFKLFHDDLLVAFCEVKTFQPDSWLDKMLEKAGPGELAGGPRPDPIYNRISNAVHTAARQLESVNPKREYFNFLALVNRDEGAKREDLVSVLTGYWDPLHGKFERTHTSYSEGRIREEKRKIDLYLWLQPSNDGGLRCKSLFFGNDERKGRICALLGLNPEKVRLIR